MIQDKENHHKISILDDVRWYPINLEKLSYIQSGAVTLMGYNLPVTHYHSTQTPV